MVSVPIIHYRKWYLSPLLSYARIHLILGILVIFFHAAKIQLGNSNCNTGLVEGIQICLYKYNYFFNN